MKTTIIYERKSGNIVHVHRGSGEKHRDVLRFVQSSHDRSQLATVEVEAHQLRACETYRINPETRKLEQSAGGIGSASGVSSRQGDSST